MNNNSRSLQRKIIVGYLTIIMMIVSMILLILYEWNRTQELKTSISEINIIYRSLNKLYLCIIDLATEGESVMSWDKSEFDRYHWRRLKADSILLEIKSECGNFVRPSQIDSLRILLESKELHLFRIMKAVQSWEKSDSLIANELPAIARRTVRMKTITRKKKGIAGLFGKKETIQIPHYTNEIQDFNERLTSVRNWRNNLMGTNIDSLRIQNRQLNYKLYDFVSFIDNHIQQSFTERNMEIRENQRASFRLFTFIMIVAVGLIIFSFFIIQFDLRNEDKIKSRLQKAIQENEDLLEMRKKIILTVSHDIRGPLGNIHNCADLVSDTREKKKREIYLDDIRHSCHHILHLVNDLMDAYRINEVGDLRNDIPFHLDRFLQRISDEFSRKANVKALILYSVHENSILTVKGDADKLEQILENLLTNAIKFTPSGSIRFHTRYSEGKLYVEISDTGIGMDNETLKRIFAPFERAAQNVNSEGFGLGLFLTKGLVKVLGGTLDVESEPGKGSLFRLQFPLPVTEELVEEDKPDGTSIILLPKKVLVVDDDPIQLKIAEDMLGRRGISCTTCMNVREAVEALVESDYDIVLTDVQMPVTDGFGLLKLLRNSDIGNSRTVPVAAMTARDDANSGIYEKEGFCGCIYKPFNIRILLGFLSSVMHKNHHPDNGGFDFSRLLENSDDYGYMLSLVVTESGKDFEEIESAIKTLDRESMKKTLHRMIPVWEILGRESLLREFQKVLHDKDSSDETVHEHAVQVMEWLRKLIEETEKELRTYEDTNC